MRPAGEMPGLRRPEDKAIVFSILYTVLPDLHYVRRSNSVGFLYIHVFCVERGFVVQTLKH